MAGFTETVEINGEIVDYDPDNKLLRIYCENCAHPNEVAAIEEGGKVTYAAFVCENCGHYNEAP
jgi:RNase P subunit RPR2